MNKHIKSLQLSLDRLSPPGVLDPKSEDVTERQPIDFGTIFDNIKDVIFIVDKTIIREGNRALLYPMLAIEDDYFQYDK